MNHFQYRDNELHCEEVPLAKIAEEVGTPTYVYSAATLERHYRVFDEALAGIDHLICFSVKANSNLAVLALLVKGGAGADIVSGGELYRFLRAGGDPRKVVFSGVGKTEAEMKQALDAGILAFNVESIGELELLDEVASASGKRAPVSLRINPDVDARTHPYISTGLKENKFGIPSAEARAAYNLADAMANIDVVGMDCHIGSQLTTTSPFAEAVERLVALIDELASDGIVLSYLDVGGGLGIPYGSQDEPEPPPPAEYGAVLRESLAPLARHKLTLICEPGRVIAGNAGSLLTRVLYRKHSENKEFVIVDAAFNDLLRPAFYDSYHPIVPVARDESRSVATVDVVGPICETGDFLARDRELPRVERGELLSVGAAGAYGFVMASNYNTRPRAAEVLVSGHEYEVVRRRESVAELMAGESIPAFVQATPTS